MWHAPLSCASYMLEGGTHLSRVNPNADTKSHSEYLFLAQKQNKKDNSITPSISIFVSLIFGHIFP
jgi:hypothetical protein